MNQVIDNLGRRSFMLKVVAATSASALAANTHAQVKLAENDPQAVALGYKADASKVDKAKQPKFAAGQLCNNCSLYQGAAGSAAGGCAIFGAKQVAAKGWCNVWAKKA